MDRARILIWDIECSHLKADFGTWLAFGFRYYGEQETHVLSITDYRGWRRNPVDDSRLTKTAREVLVNSDIWVTYNGTRFDIPWVTAKCLEHRLGVLPNTPHVDLYQVARHRLAIARKSLEKVGEFLGLPEEKTPVSGRVWKRAIAGDPEALRYIEQHCEADVLLTEKVYEALRPLVRLHPRVTFDLGTCRACGSTRLQRRGASVTINTGPRIRVQCQDCGHWDKRKEG